MKIPLKRKLLLFLHKFYTPAAWLISGVLPKKIWKNLYFGSFPRPFDEFCARYFEGCNDLWAAEVGVFRGNHAKSMLLHCGISVFYAVDGYRAYNEWENLSQLMLDAKKQAARRLSGFRGRVSVIFEEKDCLECWLPQLDIVYIDASHDEKSVSEQLDHCWKWVAYGGVMGGHDFCDEGTENISGIKYGVIPAVIKFCEKHKRKLHVKGDDWWIIK